MENYGYVSAMKKYVTFSGRAPRKEFWMFNLIYMIIAIVAAIVDYGILGTDLGNTGIVGGIIGLIHFLPSLAAGVRRLHDINRSGWWYLIIFIPLIGLIVLIVWWCKPSDTGTNEYGSNPYMMTNSEVFD